MQAFQFNGIGFNVAHLSKFTEEQFVNEFKHIHWQDVKESDRIKLLKQAFDRIKKAAKDIKKP